MLAGLKGQDPWTPSPPQLPHLPCPQKSLSSQRFLSDGKSKQTPNGTTSQPGAPMPWTTATLIPSQALLMGRKPAVWRLPSPMTRGSSTQAKRPPKDIEMQPVTQLKGRRLRREKVAGQPSPLP